MTTNAHKTRDSCAQCRAEHKGNDTHKCFHCHDVGRDWLLLFWGPELAASTAQPEQSMVASVQRAVREYGESEDVAPLTTRGVPPRRPDQWEAMLYDTGTGQLLAYAVGTTNGWVDFVEVHPRHRGKKLCNILFDYVIGQLLQHQVKAIDLVNEGGLAAYKCYLRGAKAHQLRFRCLDDTQSDVCKRMHFEVPS